ncbi:MAG: alpha-ketoacid dehydrogenase subunit beta [Gammaproteobacteria bacterium]|nr:alpha-ketoacid dehydrogenase subunit beta [Gammaproteobacteria bacterium]
MSIATPVTRKLKFFEALREAQDLCMAKDPAVYIMGLGVPDPKGIFGTTLGLQQKYGPKRVLDIPLSENAMTGVATGSALVGMRPIITHQRVDFALIAMEQMINQAAKWHYMFGGQSRVPLVIRMIIGRGWGQGPQHSQSLQSWFAHVPGLRVVMPATPHDAKGLLISSIEDDNPVIFMEHRWLYGMSDNVPDGLYRVQLGRARVVRQGQDVTIVATSYMVLEAIRAAEKLSESGIQAEVIDLRSLRPLDDATILQSVRKTGRLVMADTGWKAFGVSAEILALVTEKAFGDLKTPPRRIALPDFPAPTSPALSDHYYPRSGHIVAEILSMFGQEPKKGLFETSKGQRLDQPDPTFTGPF